MISKYQPELPRRGVPLRPDWSAYAPPPFVARACLAAAKHAFDPARYGSIELVAKVAWPGDQATLAILDRAATAPHSTSSAAVLATEAVGAFLASLAPISAAASLFAAAPRVSLGEQSTLKFPRRSAAIDSAAVTWVDEGAPARVPRLSVVGGATLGPSKKLMSIVAVSRELAEAGDAESVLDILLRESCGFSLDASVFSATAASTARPAGLLDGVAALTASAATDKAAAMADDLAALAAAISGATSGLAFVTNPKQANAIKLRRGTTWPDSVPVWSTIGIAAGTVIALDPAAVVSGFDAAPEIRASHVADLHFEDTNPQQIASGATISSPVGSLFQTDLISLRLLLRAAWCLRVPGAIAWMSGVTW